MTYDKTVFKEGDSVVLSTNTSTSSGHSVTLLTYVRTNCCRTLAIKKLQKYDTAAALGTIYK